MNVRTYVDTRQTHRTAVELIMWGLLRLAPISNFAHTRDRRILCVPIVTIFSAWFEVCRVQMCMPSSPLWSLYALGNTQAQLSWRPSLHFSSN